MAAVAGALLRVVQTGEDQLGNQLFAVEKLANGTVVTLAQQTAYARQALMIARNDPNEQESVVLLETKE